jgi:hypothetical protein
MTGDPDVDRPGRWDGAKRLVYSFARGGIPGFLTWLFRNDIRNFATRHIKGFKGAAIMFAGYLIIVTGNKLSLPVFQLIGWAVFAIRPLLWIQGNIDRYKEAAWEHEYDSDPRAIANVRAAEHRREDERAFSDDWVVFPPRKAADAKRIAARPRFGRRG